jgi:hypothetical protein
LSEKEITELEDLEPEDGDEVKGGAVLDTARKVNQRVRGELRKDGLDPIDLIK